MLASALGSYRIVVVQARTAGQTCATCVRNSDMCWQIEAGGVNGEKSNLCWSTRGEGGVMEVWEKESERVSANAVVASTYLEIGDTRTALAFLNVGLRHVRTMRDLDELVKAGKPDFELIGCAPIPKGNVYVTERGSAEFNVTFIDDRRSFAVPCRPEELHELVTFVHVEKEE